jgi:hypothetical protein
MWASNIPSGARSSICMQSTERNVSGRGSLQLDKTCDFSVESDSGERVRPGAPCGWPSRSLAKGSTSPDTVHYRVTIQRYTCSIQHLPRRHSSTSSVSTYASRMFVSWLAGASRLRPSGRKRIQPAHHRIRVCATCLPLVLAGHTIIRFLSCRIYSDALRAPPIGVTGHMGDATLSRRLLHNDQTAATDAGSHHRAAELT